MKLSILKQNPPLTNWTQAEQAAPETLDDLATLICTNVYSGSTFRHNYCNNENFEQTELMILDYDNGPGDAELTIGAAQDLFKNHKHIIAPTRSHQKEKHGITTDRFRVVLFLNQPITDEATYAATWHYVAKLFPGVDKKCKDPARRLFASTGVTSSGDGLLISPVSVPVNTQEPVQRDTSNVKRGKLSLATKNFLAEGAEPGEWNNALFKAAKDFQEQQYTQQDFEARAILITGSLDKNDLDTIKSAFKREPKYDPRSEESRAKADAWVRGWLSNAQARLDYKTGITYVKGKPRGADLILSDLVLGALAYSEQTTYLDKNDNVKHPPVIPQGHIEHSLMRWINEQDEINLHLMKTHIAHLPGTNGKSIEDWVVAVTGANKPEDVAVMRHFIWQVKRKLADKDVGWHLMPVLYGPTGSGKTKAITALLEPINSLTIAPQDLAVLGDSREAAIFGKFYVAFFDELAKADKLDVSALKNKITCTHITHRKLGTNVQITKPNVSTFIAASNNSVDAIINDPTSARRFWQIESQQRIDWDAINSIDYLEMWRSVSDSEAAPVIPYLEAISKVQEEELRVKSYVEMWLESHVAMDGGTVKATTAYESFMEWCAWQAIRSVPTFSAFGRDLRRLGIKKHRLSSGMTYQLSLKTLNMM